MEVPQGVAGVDKKTTISGLVMLLYGVKQGLKDSILKWTTFSKILGSLIFQCPLPVR